MLKRLHVRNFTVFEEADFEFSPGLNVVVGTNGTGKSHVLKLGYAVEIVRADIEADYRRISSHTPAQWQLDTGWNSRLLRVLKGVFFSWPVKLIRQNNADNSLEVAASFMQLDSEKELKFHLVKDSTSISGMLHQDSAPALSKDKSALAPVFIPPKEMLTMMPEIIGLSGQYDFLDSTYTDLARKLTIPLLNEPPTFVEAVTQALGEAMGGTIKAENGRFYLQPGVGEAFEIGLVAEGFRKLGTLAYLLGNGSLTKENTLYWDEPEANLNPALLKQLATLLVQLAAQGFQIILATHSLFLLKEFHILAQKEPKAQVRYFGLSAEPGEATRVAMTNDLELLPDIVALDAELEQSDRFQEVLDQEDADDN